MAESNGAASQTWEQTTFLESCERTSSLASAGGTTRSSSPVGPLTLPCGLAPARASRSRRQGKDSARKTLATCGPSFDASSPSAVLQSYLESRLRHALAETGSPEYALTWKHWDMRSGPPICARRASAHRTSGSGCSGWPTATVGDAKSARNSTANRQSIPPTGVHAGDTLTDAATIAGWNTTRATDGSNGGPNQSGGALSNDAAMAGWPTPKATDSHGDKPHGQGGQGLHTVSGCATPTSRDHKDTGNLTDTCKSGHTMDTLPRQTAHVAGWMTPTGNEDAAGLPGSAMQQMLGHQAHLADPDGRTHGAAPSGSSVPTEKRGALNPEFVRWLMGYPAAWGSCAATATQSSRKSRRRS